MAERLIIFFDHRSTYGTEPNGLNTVMLAVDDTVTRELVASRRVAEDEQIRRDWE
jgi:hypothetical protein